MEIPRQIFQRWSVEERNKRHAVEDLRFFLALPPVVLLFQELGRTQGLDLFVVVDIVPLASGVECRLVKRPRFVQNSVSGVVSALEVSAQRDKRVFDS